jgi:hypothetical protein
MPPLGAGQLPTPKIQRPTISNAQPPIERYWTLGFGRWEWLGVGRWKLGIYKTEQLILREELADGRVNHRPLLGREIAVTTAGNGD